MDCNGEVGILMDYIDLGQGQDRKTDKSEPRERSWSQEHESDLQGSPDIKAMKTSSYTCGSCSFMTRNLHCAECSEHWF